MNFAHAGSIRRARKRRCPTPAGSLRGTESRHTSASQVESRAGPGRCGRPLRRPDLHRVRPIPGRSVAPTSSPVSDFENDLYAHLRPPKSVSSVRRACPGSRVRHGGVIILRRPPVGERAQAPGSRGCEISADRPRIKYFLKEATIRNKLTGAFITLL